MDIKRLLESGAEIPELPASKIEQMVNDAVAYPQLQKAANENNPWLRQILASAAAVLILVAAGVHFMPPVAAPQGSESAEEAYEDMTDLMLYETLRDLS